MSIPPSVTPRPARNAAKPWYRRKSRTVPLGVLSAGLVGAIIWVSTPWPAAMVIRGLFELDAKRTVTEMEAFAPTADSLQSQLDVPYGDGGSDTTFDLYSPADTTEALPTVVWIHGGAWISGGKQNVDPYVQILAAEGFTTVAVNYTVAPEATYPTALTQLNEALAHLTANAAEYNIDPNQIVLAGDSAGAQLASQLAALATNPEYAELVGLAPALAADQLAGMVLNCGIYDVSGIPSAPGLGGYGFRVALWAYQGDKDWADTPAGQEMSTLDYVTADFPQTWISGGNADPLTANQSQPFATKLQGLGVPVTAVFYPEDHEPALQHEYQFKLAGADAQSALASTIDFLKSVTSPE
ncbi:acetyl esterase/lipase [Pseudoclavibacter sp. JAI123]|uniref:alpha/beta hydrolase n=1 Tax=Pseudoclavibacter sp. JAI123 TaxID=2723065 RepID=UPI0017B84C99|nr:alpha/beta hydrolase [Pseudoclavibacter sp. JAI123]NYF12359.1 acetyl esterase/lipase [Pseudoclavibacter sp. JAI123]